MKKVMVIVFVIGLLAVSFARAELSVEKVEKAPVVISELENPAIFELIVNNTGPSENIRVYSLIGVNIVPRIPFEINSGINTFDIKTYIPKELRKTPGFFKFEYQIKGDNSEIFKDTLMVKIVPLKDALSFSADYLSMNDSYSTILVKNTQETYFDNIFVQITSPFFSGTKNISLGPLETAELKFPIDKEKSRVISAGPYGFRATVSYNGVQGKFDGIIDYLENQDIKISSSSSGFIIRESVIEKTNEGNVPAVATIQKKYDIVSRLFTVHSVEPTKTERKGFMVYYTWEDSLEPAETFIVSSSTNYTMPLLILVFIVAIAVFVNIMLRTNIILKKKVSFVRTRGGEFALKVSVYARANKSCENIQVIDRLPGITTLYEKFGTKPDTIDNSGRRLVWKISRLNAGEERVFSYIIYSKIKVVGRFELPSATAIFEKDGKIQEASSNRAFFLGDTASSEKPF